MKVGLYGMALACMIWSLPFAQQAFTGTRPAPLEGAAWLTLVSLALLLCVEARRQP